MTGVIERRTERQNLDRTEGQEKEQKKGKMGRISGDAGKLMKM